MREETEKAFDNAMNKINYFLKRLAQEDKTLHESSDVTDYKNTRESNRRNNDG